MMSTTPLVNIVMPTYNHEKFVAQAIDSVLAQNTSFAYRLVVGDDCSTDDTQAIVRSYAEKYPSKVEFWFSKVNLGACHRNRVSLELLHQCTAKYVGILEGDDYWTETYRLQKLVDFLECHPECSVSFHDAVMFYQDGSEPSRNIMPADQKEILTLEDILTTGIFPIPCTALFRNKLLGELPDCYYRVTNGDWMLFTLLAEHGTLGYINEVMAAYRVHKGGIWSRLDPVQRIREHIKTYEAINAYLNFKYDPVLSDKIAYLRELQMQHVRAYLDESQKLVKEGEIKKGLRLLLAATRSAPPEVFRPRRLLSVIKNRLLRIPGKPGVQN